MLVSSGCANRPTPAVLDPVRLDKAPSERVTILTATNRGPDGTKAALGSSLAEKPTYERYEISVPPDRKNASISYPTPVPDPRRQFVVTGRRQLPKEALVEEASRSAQADGTVGIFVHGYNYSYQEALFRLAQMAADAKLPGSPILFSWPSAAAVAGYVADRDASLYSRSDLVSLVRSLAAERSVKRIVLFGHSMGSFLIMEAVRQLKLQKQDEAVGKLMVILAAPDIDVDVFRSQLKDIGRMPTPITLLVSKTDRALSVSSLVGGERPRVGRVDVDDPVVKDAARKEGVRLIDITSVEGSDGLGHDRYASLAKFGTQLAVLEKGQSSSVGDVGAFVFDAAGAAVASPFRLAGSMVGSLR
ncbi:alpha/beta hydrolase [Rhizobium puerariae]|uniref:Alpha/beta hydrolase n=1 Tax=Rhizobium puerariae TaxID=1585791 RepID=A0ABV6AEP8_9HYPH